MARQVRSNTHTLYTFAASFLTHLIAAAVLLINRQGWLIDQLHVLPWDEVVDLIVLREPNNPEPSITCSPDDGAQESVGCAERVGVIDCGVEGTGQRDPPGVHLLPGEERDLGLHTLADPL